MKKILMTMMLILMLYSAFCPAVICRAEGESSGKVTLLKEFGKGESGTNWKTESEVGITWQNGYDLKWTPGAKLGNISHLAAIASYTSPLQLEELLYINPDVTVNVRFRTTSEFKFGISLYWYADGCRTSGGVCRNRTNGNGTWQIFSVKLSELLEYTKKSSATDIASNWDKKSIYLALDNENPRNPDGSGLFSGSANDSVYVDSWWLDGVNLQGASDESENGGVFAYAESFSDETGFVLNGTETTLGEKQISFEARVHNFGAKSRDAVVILAVVSKDKKLKTVNMQNITLQASGVTTISKNELTTELIKIEDGDTIRAMIWSGSGNLAPLVKKNMSLVVDGSLHDERYYIYPDEEAVTFENGTAHAEAEYWRCGDKGNVIIHSELLSGAMGIQFKNPSGSEALISNPTSVYTLPVVKVTFDVEEDNTNFVAWVRYSATTNGSDSLYWGLDNNGYESHSFTMTDDDEYAWSSLGAFSPDAGIHTLNITIREYNLCIDKIVISSDPSYVPGGMGECVDGKELLTEIFYTTDMIPKSERPRVMLNSSDISDILENAQKDENRSSYASYIEYASSTDDASSLIDGIAYPADIVRIIESKAFSYVSEGNEANGKHAIRALKNLIIKCPETVASDYNTIGQTSYLIGIVYDWCYPLLCDEDKLFLQNQVIILNSLSEIGWPPAKGSAVVSHSSEGMLMRDLVACAIAMYGDREDIYQNIMGRFFGEYVTPRRDMYQKTGSYLMGNHYLQYRYQWELFADRLIDKGYGISHIFGDDYGKLMYKLIYARRPDGGMLREGDSSINGLPGQYVGLNQRLMFYASSAFNDPYLKYTAYRQKSTDTNGSYDFSSTSSIINQNINPVEFMIMNNPGVEAKSTGGFPLSRYFPAPYGSMIARTGWSEGIDSGDVVAEMKITEYSFSEHQHLDAGAFQIYYKGALANDTGYYQQANPGKSNMEEPGNTACASVHDRNYQSRTIAHNCMLVYDPGEKHISKDNLSVTVENDGGQERKNKSANPVTYEEILENEQSWRCGKVLAHEYGPDASEPDWTYLKGDISYAYSDKVSEYERSFMFLNFKNPEVPGALIVYDRVKSSDASFKKTWLLHTMNTPEVIGNQSVATVTHSGYNGKITLDTLLPEVNNTTINVVEGGEDDAWVNGTNYFADLKPGHRNEGGGARLEISPRKPSELDYFLNVMQMSDADKDFYLETVKIETDTHAGVVIADRVVLFAKQRDRVLSDITFDFDGDGEIYRITIADCREGTWEVYRDDKLVSSVCATMEGGVLPFEGTSGKYTLKYVSDEISRTVPDGSEIKDVPSYGAVRINNCFVDYQNKPFRQNSVTYIDAKDTLEFIGYDVTYSSGVLTAVNGSTSLIFKSGNRVCTKNGSGVMISAKAIDKDGVLYIPADSFKTLLGYRLTADSKSGITYMAN